MSKLLPRETALSAPYWQGCREGQLRMQQCASCKQYQFYPRTLCSHCDCEGLQWAPMSGRATVSSFTVVRRGISPDYEAPYVVALVELVEGVTMMSGIQTSDPQSLAVGAAVEVVFEDWGADIQMPMFKLTEASP